MKEKIKSEYLSEKIKSKEEDLNKENKKLEKENEPEEEKKCLYCEKQIKLNSYEMPYGKTGLLINDYFYINSEKSTVRKELSKILKYNNENNDLYENLLGDNSNDDDKNGRIISCGHFLHSQCFKKLNRKNNTKEFDFPLCQKNKIF